MWKTAKSIYKLQGELRKNPKHAVVPPIDCCGAASVSKSYVQTPKESRDCDSEWRGMDDMTDKAREMAETEDQENARPDYLEMGENPDVGTECVKSPRGTTYADDVALDEEKANVTSPFSPSSLCPSIKSFGDMESVDEEEQITKYLLKFGALPPEEEELEEQQVVKSFGEIESVDEEEQIAKYLLKIGAKPKEEELEQQGVECATSPRGTTYADNEAVEEGAPDVDALSAKEELERKSVECDGSPRGTPCADNEAVDEGAQMNTEGCLSLQGEFDNEVADNSEDSDNDSNSDGSDDDSAGFVSLLEETLLIPEDNAKTHVAYADHASAMHELDSRWSHALSRSLAQSKAMLLKQRTELEEKHQVLEVKAREELEQTMEVAVENEERLEEILSKHREEVDALKEEISSVQEEALVQTRKLVEEARAEEREKMRKEASLQKEVLALATVRGQEIEDEAAAACLAEESVQKEVLALATVRGQEIEEEAAATCLATCLAEEEEKRIRAVEEAVLAAKHEHEIELNTAVQNVKQEWNDKLTQQRDSEIEEALATARDQGAEQLKRAIEETTARVRFEVSEEARKKEEEAIAVCRAEEEEKRIRAIEEAVLNAKQEHELELEATVQKLTMEWSDKFTQLRNSEIEEALAIERRQEEEKLKRAVEETATRVRSDAIEEASICQEEGIVACRVEEEEKRIRAVEEAVLAAKQEHEVELNDTVKNLIKEWSDKLSQQHDSMVAEHEEAIDSLRLESARIFADAKNAWDKQTKQLILDHEAAIRLIKQEAAQERDEALSGLQQELEKAQMELVGSVVIATTQAEASEREAQARIDEIEIQLKQHYEKKAVEKASQEDDAATQRSGAPDTDTKEQQTIARQEVEALTKKETQSTKEEKKEMQSELQKLRGEISFLQKELEAKTREHSSASAGAKKARKPSRTSGNKLSIATPSAEATQYGQFDVISPLSMTSFQTPSERKLKGSSFDRDTIAGRSKASTIPSSKRTLTSNAKTSSTRSSQKNNAKSAKSVDRSSTKRRATGIPSIHKTPASSTSSVARTPGISRSSPSVYRSTIPHSSSTQDPSDVKLMVMNVPIAERQLQKMTKALGIDIVDDPMSATHVIAGDNNHSLRRTPKLMISLCRTSHILHMDWLLESYKAHKLKSCAHYQLLHDRNAEKNYSFSMKRTLYQGNFRRQEGGLLAGWRVLFCHGVAGRKAPKEEELHMIVNAAGGIVLKYSELPLVDIVDKGRVLVITSDPPLPQQLNDSQTSEVAANGAGFFSTQWLFNCIMQQRLSGIRRGIKAGRYASGIGKDAIHK